MAGDGLKMGLAVGGLSGGTQGVAHGIGTQRAILNNCMQGRGWRVLAY